MSESITTRCGSMLGLGTRLPRKSRDKARTLQARVWCVLCDLVNYCMMVCMPYFVCVVEYMCAW